MGAFAKIAASEGSIDLCFRLMDGTGFGQMDFLQACKFAEGDSRILMQKIARDRVKASKAVGGEKEQALVAELKQCKGQQGWDESFEKVYDLAWTVVTRIIDDVSPGD